MSSKPINLNKLFNPRGVAVVGATTNITKWGFTIFHNVVNNNYSGELYPVNTNPSITEIFGFKVYRSILDIPQDRPLDLVIIVIPAKYVLQVFEQCKQRNVKDVVVISAGFREHGGEGIELENQLKAYAQAHGIRFVGPNGMGICAMQTNLIAVMWPTKDLKQGGLSLASQSGNIGTIGISIASQRGIGLNNFVSVGNMTDLDICDYLEYFGEVDDKTEIIGLYVEGIEDGRRFINLCKRISKKKPVIILKRGGGGESARKAAISHTGAISGSDELFKALVTSAGAIFVDSLDEMFDLALAFQRWDVEHYKFQNKKVVILTLGGGWGVMTADACDRYNIELVDLPPEALNRISEMLPPYWSKGNPIDTVALLDLKVIGKILKILLEEVPEADAIFLLGIGGMGYVAKMARTSPYINEENLQVLDFGAMMEENLFENVLTLSAEWKKAIFITSLLTPEISSAIAYLKEENYPVFTSPDKMVRCYVHITDYMKWRTHNL
ncbi:MAG: acetate--CoA ligase family protein [Candidatus Hermodarchaeota archaeon]